MISSPSLKKTIAWNGIFAKMPDTWEIDSIDKDHLILGKENTPCVEIKWTRRSSRSSLVKYIKEFVSKSQKLLNIKIHELNHPRNFIPQKSNFEYFFFAWESATSKGKGVLLYCSDCNRLSMLRFFQSQNQISNLTMESIIQSYLDHSESMNTDWVIFGMEFSIPSYFQLKNFSFNPGVFEIGFKGKKTLLRLYSWGPASFLLSQKDLEKFARGRLTLPQKVTLYGNSNQGKFFQWEFQNPLFGKVQTPQHLAWMKKYNIFRVCHDDEKNRILGAFIESSKTYEHHLIQGILCDKTEIKYD